MVAQNFAVYCTDERCKDHVARYKIAAEWTVDGYSELKTFGFADDECLDRVIDSAKQRISKIKLPEGETLGELGIFLLSPGALDKELQRASGRVSA